MMLSIYNGGNEIYKKNISDFARTIYKKYGADNTQIQNPEDMIFDDENGNADVKFVFFNIFGIYTSTGSMNINSTDFYMLIKLK